MPIPSHPTWEIKDSSKLDTWIRCKRWYFFEYILGWRLDMPAQDLYFGEAWHHGREYQLLNGYEDIQGAYLKFEECYRQYFHPDTDHIYMPKTPAAALVGYLTFANEYARDLIDNEVVELDGVKMTEISGKVPISEKRFLYYRMDSIMRRREDGKIFSWDHKSSTERWINNRIWSDGFYLGIQNGTYTHCLYCMFPIEEVLGIEFCGAGFAYLKRGSSQRSQGYHCSLRRVSAFKTPDQMNNWLWHVNNYLDEIDREMERLSHCSESDPVMMCFPMNPVSCTAFRGCPYHDFCLSWQNPLQNAYEPPLGFEVDRWDPSAMDTNVKKDLTWKGSE